MKLLLCFTLCALTLVLVEGTVDQDGCRESYRVCNPSGNGAPPGINANGAPACYLKIVKLHEGQACPDNDRGVHIQHLRKHMLQLMLFFALF